MVRLLDSVPSTEHIGSDLDVRRSAMNEIGLGARNAVDGRFELQVSADEMDCVGHFYPALGGGEPLAMSRVEELVEQADIKSGVNWDLIRDALLRCNSEGIEVTDVRIAAGMPPAVHVPAHFEPEARFLEPAAPPVTDSDRVDFHRWSPYILVRKDERLARRIDEQPGATGWNVRGRPLSPIERPTAAWTSGVNARAEWDGIYAECDGRLIIERRTIGVTPILQVPADVDYSTGNIDFAGDVVVAGGVKEGFHVKCSGTLRVKTTIEATRIECAGDLIVTQGIIGKHDGYVRTEGSLACKYIENCFVEAAGGITARVGALNSIVNTLDRFETDAGGLIVGGKVYAQNGVVAGQIGTATGPATEICCGIDYRILGKLEQVRDQTMKVAERLNELRQEVKAAHAPGPELLDLERRLAYALRQLNDASVVLVRQLDRNESATVSVRETLHPNTYIEICHVSYVVSRPLRRVQLKLDKSRGAITVTPLR